MSSLSEVAQACQVSRSTVSRVVNNDPRISRSTAQKVHSAMQVLHYTPPSPIKDRRRRTEPMQEKRLHNVALIFPDHRPVALATGLSARLISGVNDAARDIGAMLFISGLPAPKQLPQVANPQESDGLIIRSPHNHALSWMAPLLNTRPLVWINPRPIGSSYGDCVFPDNASVSTLAVDYLRAKGCRRPLVINSIPEHKMYEDRVAFFTQIWPESQVIDIDTQEWAGSWMQSIKSKLSTPPLIDGIFFTDNELGVARVLHALGNTLNIPAICCGHFNQIVEALHPHLASVDVQPEMLGRTAIDMLNWRLEHPAEPVRTLSIAPILIAK